jgi:hemolysin activation/secretion protein
VREIRVLGSTVFSPAEFTKLTAPYEGRTVTQDDLEALRLALTFLYVNKGHINSGAILPDQNLADGVLTYQIIEGTLTRIDVEGNEWFRPGYLERRLALGAGTPLNVNTLQERFQYLLEDQRIRRLNADLTPGLRPGEAFLKVRMEERNPFRAWVDVNNYQSPSVGAERLLLNAEHQNLTGNGDILRFQYGRSDGLDPLVDVKYSLPVSAQDTMLSLQYRKNNFAVVEAPFDQLEIRSKSEVYGLFLRHPIYRTLMDEVALEAIVERLSNKTFLLGEPFTLSPGAQDGESVVSALRFAQEAIRRTPDQVIAFRSRFSLGVDALGATVNDGIGQPSAKFFAWLGQFQWVRRLPFLDSQYVFRADTQLASDPLFALEQFAVGGRYTVRGYRENTIVRDNALVLSMETRVPLVRNARWSDQLQLISFLDYGKGWSAFDRGDDPRYISSVGLGFRWIASISASLRTALELYWGYPFRDLQFNGNDLQDKGIHFQFSVGML